MAYARVCCRRRRVDIDIDRRVTRAVAAGEFHCRSRAATSSTGDNQLRALHVELRLVACMDRKCLVPNHIFAIRKALGDRARPARVLRNHQSAAPLPVRNGAADEAGLVDLEPVERGWVGRRAGAAAGGHIHHHGPDGVWPRCVPEGRDLGSSCYGYRKLGRDSSSRCIAGDGCIGSARNGTANGVRVRQRKRT